MKQYQALIELDIEAPDEETAIHLAAMIADNAAAAWQGVGLDKVARVVDADVGAVDLVEDEGGN